MIQGRCTPGTRAGHVARLNASPALYRPPEGAYHQPHRHDHVLFLRGRVSGCA